MDPVQPTIEFVTTPDYREGFANSVQVRGSLGDFLLTFGIMTQNVPDKVTFRAFQGVYVSPQQAKMLMQILQQNIADYEATFGEIAVRPKPGAPVSGGGPVH